MTREMIPGPALSWASQVRQYPQRGKFGDHIVQWTFMVNGRHPVECLLYYDNARRLRGILNFYPQDVPPWEKKDNVNVFVDPETRRQGIATRLIRAALERWPHLNADQQRYTPEGLALVEHLESLGGVQ